MSEEARAGEKAAVQRTVVLTCGCRYMRAEEAFRQVGTPACCVVHGIQRSVAFDGPPPNTRDAR